MRPNIPVEYQHNEEVAAVLRRGAKDYGWPSFGHDAEMKSLVYHVQRRDGLSNDMPEDWARREILTVLERSYAAARWTIPEDFLSFEHFVRVVESVDMTSSPGFPYMREATNNADFFKKKGESIPEERLREVYALVMLRIKTRDSDPIRLFIKPEPHTREKIKKRKFRLISSVSIVDQLVDAMLFGSFNQKVNEQSSFVPCKGGWSPFSGGWKMVPKGGTMSLDKSGWDWSVQPWLVEMELQLRLRLCDNMTPEWADLARWRYRELFYNAVFVTSGGCILRQKNPGVMKSGCFNTLVTNSIMQSIVHLRVCLEMDIAPGWIWTLGDDTLQELIQDRQEYLERVSQYCHVKHCVEGAEFAGMRFEGCVVEPLYRGKHSFQLLHMDKRYATEIARSYALLYHRSARLGPLKNMLGVLLDVPDEERSLVWDRW